MERVYTVGFPYCGIGGGALGFIQASKRLLNVDLKFRALGGIDFDPVACADFERLVGAPALCTDMHTLTAAELRSAWGEKAPDVVFSSPPCKGFSGLISEKVSQRPEYQRMNSLALRWVELMLEAWPAAPPRLFLLENVPRLASRGRSLLARIRKLLNAAGYICHASSHDCGELGKPRKPKRVPTHVVIRSADGTWHRPLTTLELALLQSLPATIHGQPLVLAGGKHSKARELIGNLVPPKAAEAIAEQMLLCLGSSDAQAFALSSAGGVWVEPVERIQ